MEVSDKYVEEYRSIYRKHFGVDIDLQTARGAATKLLELVSVLYEPSVGSRDGGLIEGFQAQLQQPTKRRKIRDGKERDDMREPNSHA
jgi:hypothetical protein